MPLLTFVLYNWKKYLDLVRDYHNQLGVNQTDFALMIDIPPQRYSAWRHQRIKPQKKSVDKVHKGIFSLMDKGIVEGKITQEEYQVAREKLEYLKACINLMDLEQLLNLSDNLFQSLVELPEFIYNIENLPRLAAPQLTYKATVPSLLRIPHFTRLEEMLDIKYPWEHHRQCVIDKNWLLSSKEEIDYFAITVNENNSSDRLKTGDIAIFESTDKLEEGDIGICILDSKETVIRMYQKIKNRISLTPLVGAKDAHPNIEKLNFDDLKIYGRLVCFVGKMHK